MAEDWPNKRDLDTLEKESSEHKRAWSLVLGLTRALRAERLVHHDGKCRTAKFEGAKPDDYNQNIRALEQRILSRKAHLRELEECRRFEQETEHILISAIRAAHDEPGPVAANIILEQAILTYAMRTGPRPTG
jgi:hypothetical protein